MADMTPEKAAELRRPFPSSAIGKIPKGGVMLDYVGHAATTDRLLAVDPGWTWEPLALDENGLPALDGKRNLWIRLTVCGVTRIGVGDGVSAKEVIGDAIRNAAMRFGVALDLWSKEELEGSHDDSAVPQKFVTGSGKVGEWKDGQTTIEPTPKHPLPLGITPDQLKKLKTMLSKQGITTSEDGLAFYQTVIDREVDSSKNLTRSEAHKIIDRLERAERESPVPDDEPELEGWPA